MLVLTGTVQNKIEKTYTNKQGNLIKTFDIDVKTDEERFFQTVNVDVQHGDMINVGDEVNLPVTQYANVTKSGSAFISMRLNNKAFDAQMSE